HFADIVAAQEELDRGKIAEEIFDVPVVEDALQAESAADCAVHCAGRPAPHFALRNDRLHVENIGGHDVVAIAGRVGDGGARLESRVWKKASIIPPGFRTDHSRPTTGFTRLSSR